MRTIEVNILDTTKAIERQRRIKRLEKNQPHNRLLFWYAFLMAFPVPMLIFNASIYLFPFMWEAYKRKYGYYFRSNSLPVLLVFCLIFGILVSTYDSVNIGASISVLPNYIYWSLLVIFLVSHHKNIDLSIVFEAITYGVFAVSIYYLFFRQNLGALPFLNKLTQNSFAFILICFAPIATYFIRSKYGFKYGIACVFLLTFIAFLSRSRSGIVLIFIGSFATNFSHLISPNRIIILLAIMLTGFLAIQTPPQIL